MNTKEIRVGSRTITVAGPEGDRYFQALNLEDGANEFLTRVVTEYVPDGATILDIGANIGLTTALFSTLVPGSKVYSFEPNPAAYGALSHTIELNKLTGCKLYPLALGAEPGELEFTENTVAASASHLVQPGRSLGGATTKVKVETVDEIVRREGITQLDLIKIDVEGFELDVLAGAEETLRNLKPLVFLEFNSFTLMAYGNVSPRAAIERLRTIFPRVYRLSGPDITAIESDEDLLAFLHDNLVVNRCVDDLLCSPHADELTKVRENWDLKITDLQSENARLHEVIARLQHQISEFQHTIAAQQEQNHELAAANSSLSDERKNFLLSSSWRVTAPLRQLRTWSRRIR